jgi:hypothetical protein
MSRDPAASLGPVRLSDLRAHLARDAVIVVDSSLGLVEVAEAVARDDRRVVEGWVAAGLLGKPSPALLERWERSDGDVALSVVVQPFVLLQDRTG